MTASTRTRRVSALRPRTWSFAAKATLVPSLGLLMVVAVLAVLINRAIREVQLTSVQSDFRLLSESQSRRVTQGIVREVSLLNALAHNALIIDHLQEHHDQAASGEIPASHDAVAPRIGDQIDIFSRRFPQYELIVIVDGEGHLVATSGDQARTDFSDEEWLSFAASTTAGRLYLNVPQALDAGAVDDGMMTEGMEIALPVLSSANEPIGVVYAVWDVASSADVTAGSIAARVIVLDRGGAIIAGSEPDAGQAQALDPNLVSQMKAGESGSVVGLDEQGAETIFGFSSLVGLTQMVEFEQTEAFEFDVSAAVQSLNWTVIVSQGVDTALAATGLLAQRVLILLGAGTVVVIAGIFLFARALIAPLNRLTEAAGQIGAGRLETPIPVSGSDEVGQLAEVLRGMVTQLVHRVDQLRAASEVTHVAQARLDVEEMLQGVTDAIHERLGLAQARVYLVEMGGERSRLLAASGEVDPRVLEIDREGLSVTSQNVVGEAILEGRAQLNTTTGFLTGTGSEIAVPLFSGEGVLGVLYVASDETERLDEDDLSVIELLADQVSTSIQNARLFEQSASNLRQIEALNRRLTQEGWLDFVGQRGQLRYALRGETDAETWPESMDEVTRSGMVVAQESGGGDGQAVLAVPITLRGEVIGTLGIKRRAGHEWSDDEIALVQAVGERVGLIAEDIRLLDEADRTARREQTVSEVSARLQRTTQLDSLLQVALSELSGALGTDNISLRLGSPPGDNPDGGEVGN